MTSRAGKQILVFGSPLVEGDEIAEVVDSVRTGGLGKGQMVHRFKKAMGENKVVSRAMAFNSYMAALHLSILSKSAGVRTLLADILVCLLGRNGGENRPNHGVGVLYPTCAEWFKL